jgi:hypothetical protein
MIRPQDVVTILLTALTSTWLDPYVLFICFAISSSAKCLRVSKTESYGLSRICFEMTRRATMPSSSEKCLRVSKTESHGLSRICFEMTRQATMPSSKAWLCLADEQHNRGLYPSWGQQGVYIIRWDFNVDFVFRRVQWLHTRGRWCRKMAKINLNQN